MYCPSPGGSRIAVHEAACAAKRPSTSSRTAVITVGFAAMLSVGRAPLKDTPSFPTSAYAASVTQAYVGRLCLGAVRFLPVVDLPKSKVLGLSPWTSSAQVAIFARRSALQLVAKYYGLEQNGTNDSRFVCGPTLMRVRKRARRLPCAHACTTAWYHGKMSRVLCEGTLSTSSSQNGDFIVRESSSQGGFLAISVRDTQNPRGFRHFLVHWKNGSWVRGGHSSRRRVLSRPQSGRNGRCRAVPSWNRFTCVSKG